MNVTQIGALAYEALLREARATPKPGLVDKNNCGAHDDMDLPLFERSAAAIHPYFVQFAQRGASEAHETLDTRLAGIRHVGVEAERAMFEATNGVNTHKGAIFTLGVLTYICGRLSLNGARLLPDAICRAAGRMCRDVESELIKGGGKTKGERAYLQFGATGIRGEAARGFPSIAGIALPALNKALEAAYSENDCLCQVLLHLIANVTDTNVLTRAGAEGAEYARQAAGAFLLRHSPQQAGYYEALCALDAAFIARNLSPGGCADLMAAAWFLDSVCRT